MAALPPYIPSRDSKLDLWANNFQTLIAANPALYGLMAADAVIITAAYDTWNAAYLLVTSPSTKTAMTVSAKNTARVTMLAILRPYAINISLNAGVASGDKTALGVNPRTSTPSPITPPTTNPVLYLQSAQYLSAYVRYRDSAATPSVKAKPYGVVQIQIFAKSAAAPITDPATLPLLTTATKSPVVLNLAGQTVGQQLYLAARWVLKTGGFSPWSPIINFTVVGAA